MNTATKTFTAIFRNPDELFVIKKQKSYRIRNLNICYSTFRRVPVRHLPYPMYKISGFIDFLNQLPTVILNGPWYVTVRPARTEKKFNKINQSSKIILTVVAVAATAAAVGHLFLLGSLLLMAL